MDAILMMLNDSVDILGFEIPYSAIFGLIIISFGLAALGMGYFINQILQESAWNKANEMVLKKSTKYKSILDLNRSTFFYKDIEPEYLFEFNCKSKQAFDNFNYLKHAEELVMKYGNEQNILIEKCNKNLDTSLDYEVAYNQILNSKSVFDEEPEFDELFTKTSKYYTRELLLKVENTKCNEIKEKPIITPRFKIVKKYVSPQGRSSHMDYIIYSIRDLEELIDDIREKEAKKNSKEYQRRAMTQSLRYDILKRDNFRCTICGREASDGVKLHVDHIIPVARGGKTVESNLRTLCEDCNMGKSDKYDYSGVN